ncbi:GNAT family N-acetyltransferase [Rhizobium calliandrae]|uniref:GNAT family N-acetyltransferase n=1 Tax=Rhizobium calliandrae TaxID=1312182 RepID=A0ABT7KAE9_9HYPH|nr:GNAT family N-acetyltransferase [Rhizobium calliandrae]MDL2404089.1 GNAT family N-acetyltransferase [Rhizobium calliandrae]
MTVRAPTEQDADWIAKLLIERWGSTVVVAHGGAFDLLKLPALVAEPDRGLATYRAGDDEAELMSLDAVCPGQGVGTLLIDALADLLRKRGISCLWVTTTNDNLTALRFYQRRGFELRRVRPGAVDAARLLKPAIPQIGNHGIPIRDEIDLCCRLL